MGIDKFSIYVQAVKILMEKELLELIWYKQVGRVRASKKIDEELLVISELLESSEPLEREELFKVANDVMSITRNVALGLKQENETEEFELVSKEIINPDMISKVNIHLTSKFDVLQNIDTEIFTKRSEEDPLQVITHSAGLTLYTTDGFEDDIVSQQTIELSINQIENLISQLSKTVDSLKLLNTKEVKNYDLSSVE
ncbi:hypothetical protein AADC60_07970 [Cytobacillus pseudoceanisediminis]|uniref:Uncharacterized protein n=1 Tax=Cytobacillus pseudoceanisediminis TaxID=3051614 RepID=A0ABZ2ZLQ2_9BACI